MQEHKFGCVCDCIKMCLCSHAHECKLLLRPNDVQLLFPMSVYASPSSSPFPLVFSVYLHTYMFQRTTPPPQRRAARQAPAPTLCRGETARRDCRHIHPFFNGNNRPSAFRSLDTGHSSAMMPPLFYGRDQFKRTDGKNRVALPAPRVCFPVLGDLRRTQRIVGLRPAWHRAEAQHQGGVEIGRASCRERV